MDIYIARQPIFDRYMKVYGYELLYRKDNRNSFAGIDDDQATAELIYNSFMVMGLSDLTDGALGFINFSKELINSEIPFLLPSRNVVIEVLEREEATEATVEACKKLRERGYTLALDDYIPGKDNALFGYADIVKVEYPAVSLEDQRALIRQFGAQKTFLAEKIETREDYRLAVEMGYHLFQGYFFSKPTMIGTKEIASLNTNVLHIMEQLNSPEPSYDVIAAYIERDLGLSFKLLKLVNSVYFGPRNRIKTIQHALAHLGIKEMNRWFSIMMLKEIRNVENAEMIKISLIRGKFTELLAGELYGDGSQIDYFFTGVFSLLDILLNKPMRQILNGLPISDGVKGALMGERNEYRELLNLVIANESHNWDQADSVPLPPQLSARRFTMLYLESLKWAMTLSYRV